MVTIENPQLLSWWHLDECFGPNFTPKYGDIHVLVMLPPLEEKVRSEDDFVSLIKDQVEMSVSESFQERDRQRSEYSILRCPTSKEDVLTGHLGLQFGSIEFVEEHDDTVNGFQWTDFPKSRSEQREAYIQYIEDNLESAFSSGDQEYFIVDASAKRTLLTCHDLTRMPFKVNGTTDVMIIDSVAQGMGDVFAGLRFVIEVKKQTPSDTDRWQLLLEIIVADLKSEMRRAPVGLLTDLNNYWYFLWIGEGKKVVRITLHSPANGFKLMEDILKDKSRPTSDGSYTMHIPFLESSSPPLKRQRLINILPSSDDGAALLEDTN